MSDEPEQTENDLVRHLTRLGEEAEALRQRIDEAADLERRSGLRDRRRVARVDPGRRVTDRDVEPS
jgi:hypothetical protein